MTMSKNGPEPSLQNNVGIIIGIFLITITFYILLKGSQLFKKLSNGLTPFSDEFSKSLKVLGLVLIVTDIVAPFLYSTTLTLFIEDGYYIQIVFTSRLLTGFILYAGSQILDYGKELQQLSDHTV